LGRWKCGWDGSCKCLWCNERRLLTRQWAEYLFRDYMHTAEEASLLDRWGGCSGPSSRQLKTVEIGLVAGVQTEAEEDRIWFSITTTRKTMDRVKDMERVSKAMPTLFVYYPGEPYFYSMPNMM
jgi:hypothetical protein